MPPVLQLSNATVIRGDARILDSLTLSIAAGEHTAIMGPNGAGKSALMQLLTLQNRPLARGDDGPPPVRVLGDDRWNVFELRSRLGVVSADLHHRLVLGNSWGRIRVADAVLSGHFGMHGLAPPDAVSDAMREAVTVALDRLEAGHLAHRYVDELSTGEARRVVIARALVTKPEALVLDEPSTGLDLVARARLVHSMNRLAESGTTLILVTHQVEEILPAITKVVFLKRGRVFADGSRADLLTGPQLSRLFDAPVELAEAHGQLSARILRAPAMKRGADDAAVGTS